jgi:hypothetical protein
MAQPAAAPHTAQRLGSDQVAQQALESQETEQRGLPVAGQTVQMDSLPFSAPSHALPRQAQTPRQIAQPSHDQT